MIPCPEAAVITADDLRLFAGEIEELLRSYFPFGALQFLLCGKEEEVDALLSKIPFSDRQRERAKSHVSGRRPFWDRILNQALIPLPIPGDTGSGTIVCRISDMPKNVGAEEGSWLLDLTAEVLRGSIEKKKMGLLCSSSQGIPDYIGRMMEQASGRPSDILELSLAMACSQDISVLANMAKAFFKAERADFSGIAGSSVWFVLEAVSVEETARALRGLHARLGRLGYRPKGVRLFGGTDGISRLASMRALALGLRARVFSAGDAMTFLTENGLGFGDFSLLSSLRASSGSVGCLFVFSSHNRRNKALELLQGLGSGYDIDDRGYYLLVSPKAVGGSKGLRKWCEGLFSTVKEGVDEHVKAGFASPLQPFVTTGNLFFASLLALHHAHLLGEGNMALHDHVTCNVHGDILLSWGDLTGAVECYRKGLRIEPEDINLMNSLGACLAERGRLKEAERLFQRVVRKEPDNVMALYNLSGILHRKKRFGRAYETVKKALELDPSNAAILTRLVHIASDMDRWDEVGELCRRIGKMSLPIGRRLQFLCARAAFESGDWPEAKEMLKRCLKDGRDDLQSLLLLAKGFLVFDEDEDTCGLLLERFWNKGPADRSLVREARRLEKALEGRGSKDKGHRHGPRLRRQKQSP